LVSFVSFAADKEPVVVGKPTTLSRDILQKTHGEFNPARTMMVGDRSVWTVSCYCNGLSILVAGNIIYTKRVPV